LTNFRKLKGGNFFETHCSSSSSAGFSGHFFVKNWDP